MAVAQSPGALCPPGAERDGAAAASVLNFGVTSSAHWNGCAAGKGISKRGSGVGVQEGCL